MKNTILYQEGLHEDSSYPQKQCEEEKTSNLDVLDSNPDHPYTHLSP